MTISGPPDPALPAGSTPDTSPGAPTTADTAHEGTPTTPAASTPPESGLVTGRRHRE